MSHYYDLVSWTPGIRWTSCLGEGDFPRNENIIIVVAVLVNFFLSLLLFYLKKRYIVLEGSAKSGGIRRLSCLLVLFSLFFMCPTF